MKFHLVLLVLGTLGSQPTLADNSLVVYSARKEHLIKPVFEQYTKETGVKVKYLTDKAPALLSKLKGEGRNTPGLNSLLLAIS